MGQDDQAGQESGLPEPLEALITGCRDGVQRLIRRRMRRKPQDIEDIAQETYLRLLRLVPRGNINNPETLFSKGPEEVRREVYKNLEAGVQLVGPECAIPLQTAIENLKEIPKAVRDWHREHSNSAAPGTTG